MKKIYLLAALLFICNCGSGSNESANVGDITTTPSSNNSNSSNSTDSTSDAPSELVTSGGIPVAPSSDYKKIRTLEGKFSETSATMPDGQYMYDFYIGTYDQALTVELYLDGLTSIGGFDPKSGSSDDITIDPKLMVFDLNKTETDPDDPSGKITNVLYKDDDSGLMNNAYLKFTTEPSGNYLVRLTTYDIGDIGDWTLFFNLRTSHDSEDILKQEDEPSSASTNNTDDHCYRKDCPLQCYRWEYSSCSCIMRLDYSYCMEMGWE